jgi:hypothetical protein
MQVWSRSYALKLLAITALPQQPFGHQDMGQVSLLRLRGRILLVGFPKVVVKALRLR